MPAHHANDDGDLVMPSMPCNVGTIARVAASVAVSPPLGLDTYVYEVIPFGDRLVSISSDDSLRLVEPQTLQYIPDCTSIHDGVTCLKAIHGRGVLTAGRNGVVKCTDLRTKTTAQEISKDVRQPILSLACEENVIATGTELTSAQATVTLWDLRAIQQPLLQYIESHNDDVTELSFNPSNPSILLSGSTDGLINLYDTSITDEDDALIQVFNHGSSVAHAGFLSDHEVYGLSHDEIFCIFDTNDCHQDEAHESSHAHAFGDLRPQLHCEYVVNIVSSDKSAPIVGAASHSARYLDLISLQRLPTWSFDTSNLVRLSGAHEEEIVRSMCFSGDSNTIFTGGEDGFIRAWRVAEETAGEGRQPAVQGKGQKKRNGSDKSERARFRPY
ncbi:MAG: hypothetical protein Q9185_000589 [Variospora sp. 1 TL-2023]